MRGAPDRAGQATLAQRIIPADAGSTATGWSRSCVARDHPRGCGEHASENMSELTNGGSSPRMRGALLGYLHVQTAQGIIPADAGSTIPRSGKTHGKRDHPRGCGEHAWEPLGWEPVAGSSPRMRGALLQAEPCRACGRIIPADAGSTKSLLMPSTPQPDHPRGCGEHPGRCSLLMRARGSSPQMRGALSCHIRPSID